MWDGAQALIYAAKYGRSENPITFALKVIYEQLLGLRWCTEDSGLG
jgi:hypothetical protein